MDVAAGEWVFEHAEEGEVFPGRVRLQEDARVGDVRGGGAAGDEEHLRDRFGGAEEFVQRQLRLSVVGCRRTPAGGWRDMRGRPSGYRGSLGGEEKGEELFVGEVGGGRACCEGAGVFLDIEFQRLLHKARVAEVFLRAFARGGFEA